MSLTVIGINHKTASVALREQMAFNPERLTLAYQHALNAGIDNMMILSTCNRTEIYCHRHSPKHILHWLSAFLTLPEQKITPLLYHHQHDDALKHMVRVAAGLDSMILGEPQILGQLKQAYATAQTHGQLNKKFMWLIEQVFAATKKVRSESKIGEQAVSLGYAVAKLGDQIFDDLSQNTLMIVAAGEMNQLVARHLCRQGIGKLIICNRSQERAENFANALKKEYTLPIRIVPFTTLPDVMHEADIISSCTASLTVEIPKSWAKKAIKKRRYKPMLMVDLAIPRDIENTVEKIDDIYLYAIDDLAHVLDENIEKRKTASVYAEVMVSQHVSQINNNQRLKDIGHYLSDYKAKIDEMSQAQLEKAQKQLQQGDDADVVLQTLTHQLTAKLTHAQFRLLREAASLDDAAVLQFIVENLTENVAKH